MADLKTVLDGINAPNSVKADAWDAVTQASSPEDLKARLDKLPLAGGVKASLWDAKASIHTAAPAPKPAGQSWSDKLGLRLPISRGAVDFVEGAVSGLASTAVNAAKLGDTLSGGPLVRKIMGTPDPLSDPRAQRAIQSATATPDSIPGQAGRLVEQGAEMFVPLAKVAKAASGASLLGRALAEGLATGGVSAVQTGGDPVATATGAALGAAGPALGAAAQGAGKAISETRAAQKIYQSALKPTWSMVKKEGLEMLDTGLKEQIPVSAKGLEMVEQRIKDIRQQITDGIQARAMQGRTVNADNVLKSLDDLYDFYRNTAAPEDSLKILDGLKEQFKKYHGQEIPLDAAQKIKINTYQELKKSYGEMAGAKIEGLKQIARGIKEQISGAFPEIAGLNEQQSKLLGLDDALYRAVWRIENHQLMGIGSPLATTAGHAVMGGPGAVVGLLGKFVLDNPGIKSKLAIRLAKAGTPNAMTEVGKRMTALRTALQESVNSTIQPQSIGQPAPQPAQ